MATKLERLAKHIADHVVLVEHFEADAESEKQKNTKSLWYAGYSAGEASAWKLEAGWLRDLLKEWAPEYLPKLAGAALARVEGGVTWT